MKVWRHLSEGFKSEYKIGGQAKEQHLRYDITGEVVKADNKNHSVCADCGNIQIKSARATICKGVDIDSYLAEDAADFFAYITKANDVYLMTKAQWSEMAKAFGTVTTESKKNGGSKKIRLRYETPEMLAWLAKK